MLTGMEDTTTLMEDTTMLTENTTPTIPKRKKPK